MKISPVAGILGVALVALYVSPAQCVPVPEPDGALIDIAALVGIDLSGLGKLLNDLLSTILDLGSASKCEYESMAGQIEGIVADILVEVNLLGIDIQVQVLLILGPLLEAVAELLEALLGDLSIDLSVVINLILNLLLSLNLNLDAAVALKLGNLINLDVLALIHLG